MLTTAPTQQITPGRHRFTTDEYHRMAEAGILHEDDRVELIDGELIEMAAVGIPHSNALAALNEIAVTTLRKTVRITVQDPIHLDPHNEPEPDLVIARRRNYTTTHPTPGDISLVIEVADSSLDHDRNTKLPRYAAAGIAESWLVNLNGQAIERHSGLQNGRYSHIVIAGPGETLASTTLPTFIVVVNDILTPDAE